MKPSPSLGNVLDNAPAYAMPAVSAVDAAVKGAKESANIALAAAAKEAQAAKDRRDAEALVVNVDPLAAAPAKPASEDPMAGLDSLAMPEVKPASAKTETKAPEKAGQGGDDVLADLTAPEKPVAAPKETSEVRIGLKEIRMALDASGLQESELKALAVTVDALEEPTKSEAIRKIQEDPKTFVEWLKTNGLTKTNQIQERLSENDRKFKGSETNLKNREVRESGRGEILKRIREANPEAAAQMDAAFATYEDHVKKENAERVKRNEAPVAPMTANEFATGWFVANAALVIAGAPESKRADLAKDLDALRDTDSASVDRFLKEMPDGFSKRSYESGARAAALSAGIANPDHKDEKPVSEKRLKDGTVVREWDDGTTTETREGETVMRGPKGTVVIRKDGVTVLDREGKTVKNVDSDRPGTTFVHGIGYPVSNAGRKPEEIEMRTRAAEFWCGMAEGGGFPFVSGKLMKTFEEAMRADPSLSGGVVFRADETDVPPTKGQMEAMATFFERSVGLEKGTIFDRDRGFSMRASFREKCGGSGPEAFLRDRFFNGWPGKDGKRESGPAWNGSLDRSRLLQLLSAKDEKDGAAKGEGKKGAEETI